MVIVNLAPFYQKLAGIGPRVLKAFCGLIERYFFS